MAKNKQKRKKQVSTAQYLNEITYIELYNWLKLIALNATKWNNLPSSVDERYLNLMLCERGTVVFFKDEVLGYLTLPVNMSGEFNVYGIPEKYVAYSSTSSYTNQDLNSKNSVLIFNNYLRTSTELLIQIYANKLANLSRSIDVNVSAQRTPVAVACTEQQKLTMRNVITDYDGNEPFIFITDLADVNSLKAINTQAPFVADKMENLAHAILNDFLSRLGYENSNADKKERMVSSEVNANYGQIEGSRNIYLSSRTDACKRINEMFPDLPKK